MPEAGVICPGMIVVGDSIDTDRIYPGCYLALTDPKGNGCHCLEGVSKDISPGLENMQ